MSRPLVLVAVTALLAIGGALWFLQLEDSAPAEFAERSSPPATTPFVDEVNLAADAQRVETTVPVDSPVTTETPIPPSYQKALSGITGRILHPDLTPVPNLPVSIVQGKILDWFLTPNAFLSGVPKYPSLEASRGDTDEEGRFLLKHVEPHALHLLGIDLGGPLSTFRVIDETPQPSALVDLGDIVLEPSVTLVGRVLDPEGSPVAGARVRATNLPSLIFQFGVQDIRRGVAFVVDEGPQKTVFEIPPALWKFEKLLPVPTTTSNEQGEFRLAGVPMGLVNVVADKLQYLGTVKSGVPTGRRPERKIGDIYLTAGVRVRGQVLRGDGEPASVEVKVGMPIAGFPAQGAMLQPAERTSAEGLFEMSGLPSGNNCWVALRESRGHPWKAHGPFPIGEEPVIIRLAGSVPVQVTLRSVDGTTIPEAELFVAPKSEIPLFVPLLSPPVQRLQNVKVVEPGVMSIQELGSGSYELVGSAEGFALARTILEIDDAPLECSLEFEAGHTVEVRMTESDEQTPLEWGLVSIRPSGEFRPPLDQQRSDDQGMARLSRLPAGEYQLTAEHPAWASRTVSITVPCDPVELALASGGELQGRVHHAGAPPKDPVFLMAMPDIEDDEWNATVLPLLIPTLPDGRFRYPGMQAGDYEYQVRDRIVGKGPLSLVTTMRDDPQTEGEFRIDLGETTVVDIDLSGGEGGATAQLRGSVWINGEPRPDLLVQWEGDKSRTVETEDDGRFEFPALPSGEGTLRVQDVSDGAFFSLASSLYEEEITLEVGAVIERSIDLVVTSLSGRITGPGILPAGPGTFVILRNNINNSNQVTSPNLLTGGYEFRSVPLGEYTLQVYKEGAAPYQRTIVLDAQRRDNVYDVTLYEPVTIDGVLAFPPEVELARAESIQFRIESADDSGQRMGGTRVDPTTRSFEVTNLSPMRARGVVVVEYPEGDPWNGSVDFEIPSGSTTGLVLQVSPGATAQ